MIDTTHVGDHNRTPPGRLARVVKRRVERITNRTGATDKMSNSTPTQPASFETAYQVLHSSGNETEERRGAERHPFRHTQRVAAYDGQQSLSELRFFPVLCHDISRRGISFVLPDRIDFTNLILELKLGDEPTYYLAEAVNSRYASDSQINEWAGAYSAMLPASQRPVLIGCRLVEKVDLAED